MACFTSSCSVVFTSRSINVAHHSYNTQWHILDSVILTGYPFICCFRYRSDWITLMEERDRGHNFDQRLWPLTMQNRLFAKYIPWCLQISRYGSAFYGAILIYESCFLTHVHLHLRVRCSYSRHNIGWLPILCHEYVDKTTIQSAKHR